jgi:hypothetical protein
VNGDAVGWLSVAPREEYKAILAGAVEYAFAHGATSVEAYPHVTGERDYTGHTELCARAGFRHVLNANRRAIVRLEAAT